MMSSPVSTIPVDVTVAEAQSATLATGHSALPIVDADNRCVGVIGRGDLLSVDDDRCASVLSVANEDVVSVASNASLLDALSVMLEESVDHLPVIDDDRLVGICTRTDILAARRRQLSHEQVEPGLVSRLRRDRKAGPTR